MQLTSLKTLGDEPATSLVKDSISADDRLLSHALSCNNLGEVQFQLGDFDSAEASYRRSLSLAETRVSTSESFEVSRIRSAAMVNLGNLYRSTGRADEALSVYQDALEIQTKLRDEEQDNAVLSRELAVSLAQLSLLHAGRDLSVASDYNQRAVDIHQALVKRNPDDLVALSELSTCFNQRGKIFHRQGEIAEAQLAYRESIKVQERLVARVPSVARFREQLAVAHNNLGQMLCANKSDPSSAIEHFRSAEKLLSDLTKKAPSAPHYAAQLGGTLGNLAPMLESTDPSVAESLYQQAIDHQERAIKRAPKTAEFRVWLSSSYFKCARFLRAKNQFDRAGDLAIKRSQLWTGDPEHQYRVAIELAETATAAREHSKIASRWQDAAVKTLNKAVELGLKDQTTKINHIAFDRLRTRHDFPTPVTK